MEVMFVTIENPVAAFTYTPISGCSPLDVSFMNNSTPSSGLSYEWDFGDGGNSTISNPNHTFNNSSQAFDSIYTIQLIAIAGTGCTDTVTSQVTVYALPIADFGIRIGTLIKLKSHSYSLFNLLLTWVAMRDKI